MCLPHRRCATRHGLSGGRSSIAKSGPGARQPVTGRLLLIRSAHRIRARVPPARAAAPRSSRAVALDALAICDADRPARRRMASKDGSCARSTSMRYSCAVRRGMVLDALAVGDTRRCTGPAGNSQAMTAGPRQTADELALERAGASPDNRPACRARLRPRPGVAGALDRATARKFVRHRSKRRTRNHSG